MAETRMAFSRYGSSSLGWGSTRLELRDTSRSKADANIVRAANLYTVRIGVLFSVIPKLYAACACRTSSTKFRGKAFCEKQRQRIHQGQNCPAWSHPAEILHFYGASSSEVIVV